MTTPVKATEVFTLEDFNALPEARAVRQLETCCTAMRWCQAMVAERPFASLEKVLQKAESCWSQMAEADVLEAFAGHPKIGDINSLRAKYAHTAGLAGAEQGAVNQATEEVLQALKSGNQQYEEQNGFIFIVCATGKSASEMLDILQGRLANDRATELKTGAQEQAKITAIRLQKLFSV